jgi:hypothetical protein
MIVGTCVLTLNFDLIFWKKKFVVVSKCMRGGPANYFYLRRSI